MAANSFYKIILSPQQVAEDSLHLARMLYEDGVLDRGNDEETPNAFFGIWRGGAVVAAFVTSGLNRYRVRHHTHSATGKSYGPGIGQQSSGIEIYNMEELMRHFRERRYRMVCGIDDVHDTGRTGHAFRNIMRHGLRRDEAFKSEDRNGDTVYYFAMSAREDEYALKVHLTRDIEPLDEDVRILIVTPYDKPHANKTEFGPDFCVRHFDINSEGMWPWIVFPWEAAEDLTPEELFATNLRFYDILYDDAREN